ncbi:MAG: CoA transferase [Gammaproteobacteria bacterium]|nr:CoA transferase [Gammaproteobacteria bacterium]
MTVMKPLSGIRVLEMGQLIAGPFAGQVLGYFGAEVVKVEPPGRGDPLRTWRTLDSSGTSYWWHSIARNKKSLSLNLNEPQGQQLAQRLIEKADVLVENFRPGKMEQWGLGPDTFETSNPDLIYTRVSGYGQSGPYSDRLGFASACEGVAGFRYLNGYPGETPVRPNLSLGDTLAGMHAVIGTLLALQARQRLSSDSTTTPTGGGQVVDVSIVESIFNMMEGVLPEYSGAGIVREPSGSTLTGIVPTNTYRCADKKFVVIGGNGDSIFKRLMICAEREDLAEDPELADNVGRVAHEERIDAALQSWTMRYSSQVILQKLADHQVPAGPINSIADIASDPHFMARSAFETIQVEGDSRQIPAVYPRLQRTPGSTERGGPAVGEHTEEVLKAWLNSTNSDLERYQTDGIV